MTRSTDQPTQPVHTASVAVIGAGMAGLIAARRLRAHGVDVIVLESGSRPGGRVLAETTVLGSRVDLGGQWIGRGHHRLASLATQLGVTVFAMRTPTVPTLIDGDVSIRNSTPSVIATAAALLCCEAASRLGAPRAWKKHSVAACLRHVPNRRARRLLEVLASTSSTADLDRYSMHAFLAAIRYQGGLLPMLSTAGGAQESLVVEGVGTLAERLAAELGDRVVFDSEVTALDRDDTGVTIHSSSGVHRAAKVIVTVAAPVAARIEHRPPLPGERIRLQDNTYMGSVYKAIAVYDRPFWREHGHAESMVLAEPGMAVFDTSAPDGPGHLCVLVAGPEARELDRHGIEARRAAVLDPLVHHLGTEILEPRGWHEKAWHLDEHVGGGYSALPDIGADDGYFPFTSTPIGHLHWAGTETAREHAGYIEGAIESGERAAEEVWRRLTGSDADPGE
ncbi:flavin monoamine oxidase family protein [Nocardia caishijiensis]|uniref:Monoamine oxidase n=1 Tax=Nocardia caishijiensis TaxID=184756 RepID=A0ABQ6YHX5_9NOCA|nr:FAD-dependent oxidoreductase [Nocardia caishijiensis]KAF0845316.1 monoamine oxidase [Nocardia caishijiensis]